jgi:hypothetical protein
MQVEKSKFAAILEKLIATPPKPITPKQKARKAPTNTFAATFKRGVIGIVSASPISCFAGWLGSRRLESGF